MLTIERGDTTPCLLAASIGDFVRVRAIRTDVLRRACARLGIKGGELLRVRAHAPTHLYVELHDGAVVRLDREWAQYILVTPRLSGSGSDPSSRSSGAAGTARIRPIDRGNRYGADQAHRGGNPGAVAIASARTRAEVVISNGETPSRKTMVATLREQIQGAIYFGRLSVGDRLPSIREIAKALGVTKHDAVVAYSILEQEGLVEKRERSGVFVASLQRTVQAGSSETTDWLTRVLTEAREHLIRIPALPEIIQRFSATVSLRCACVDSDLDSLDALCWESRRHFGLDSFAIEPECLQADGSGALVEVDRLPGELREADLLVTTAYHVPVMREVAETLGVPLVVAGLSHELVDTIERFAIRKDSLTIVCVDPRFGDRIRKLLGERERDRVRVVLAEDTAAVERLDPNVPVLLTRAAAEQLSAQPLRRLVPRFPDFSLQSARELAQVVVQLNASASGA